jgi:acyl-CoA synthetase (AMP-forming)/AMP-acid ligase II
MALIDLISSVPAGNTALVRPESDFRLTYGALRRQVEILADALAAAGLRKNDRVALSLHNEPALVVAILAVSTIGAAVPLDDRSARVIILPSDSPDGIPRVQPKSVPKSVPESVPDDVAVILKTRGTAGPPKQVPLSHENLILSARNTAELLSLGPGDVTLCVMPIAHIQGLVTATLATLAAGGTVVIPGGFHPLAFWRIARDHGVTWFTAAPTIHQWLLARTADPGARRPAGAARLRFIRSAGSTLPPAVAQTLESAFGVPVLDAYEVTEASGDVSASQIAILDADGQPREPGRRGEVALAGPSVARGYDNDPERTRKFFVDGWFRTGDFGYLDARGQLTLL